MAKREIDEYGRPEGKNHRNMAISTCLDILKKRSLRMYGDVVRAFFEQGPYYLDQAYSKFELRYSDWKDMQRDEKLMHVKRFLSFKPKPPKKGPNTTAQGEGRQQRGHQDSCSLNGNIARSTSTCSVAPKPTQRRIAISPGDLNIPATVLRKEMLDKIFIDAQLLLDDKESIADVPSRDPNVKAVKNSGSLEPLIVKPQAKNKCLFQCTCRTFTACRAICHHTLAVAFVVGKLVEYCAAVKKNLTSYNAKKGAQMPNLASAIEQDLPNTLKGMKQNEIVKTALRRKSKAMQNVEPQLSTSESSTTSSQQVAPFIPSGTIQPRLGYSSTTSALENSIPVLRHPFDSLQLDDAQGLPSFGSWFQKDASLHAMPSEQPFQISTFNIQTNGQQPAVSNQFLFTPRAQEVSTSVSSQRDITTWHSGLSPYPYQLIIYPTGVSRCYGCNQDFADKYKVPPNNVIVRHNDRRIRGKDANGRVYHNETFSFAYYHANRLHIEKKNPIFNGDVLISSALYNSLGDEKVRSLRATCGLNVRVIID